MGWGVVRLTRRTAMGFPPKVKEDSLVKARRCCCICHQFAGLYTNVHHIIQKADGGPHTLENAVVLCLKCHGEVGHYNKDHPIGDKYSPGEVKRHRNAWWEWCEKGPYAPLPHDPISLSPHEIRVASGGWDAKIALKIHNKTDAVYYAVWVKFHLGIAGLRKEDVSLDEFLLPPILTGEIGDFKVAFDVVVLFGSDGTGSESLYLVLAAIDPKKTITVPVTITGNKSQEGAKIIPVTLLSYSAEDEGPPVLVQNDGQTQQVAFKYRAPEAMNIRGLGLRWEPV
jgi:hypothetical protein